MSDRLEADLLKAHATDDLSAFVTLYTQAADHCDNTDRACFFLTQAWIFALEIDDPRAVALKARLINCGRDVE